MAITPAATPYHAPRYRNGRRMKPSVAPRCCSTPISSRRDWMSRRTVLPTTSSAPSQSSSASTSATRLPKRSQTSRRWRQTASCCTSSASGSCASESASRASSPRGPTTSTLGSGFWPSASSASPRPAARNCSTPCCGVRSSTDATSSRPRSSSASACARAASTSCCRNTLISRDCCTSPDSRATFASTSHSPSGNARATAITPTVSTVAQGLPSMRPRLAVKLYAWWSSHAPTPDRRAPPPFPVPCSPCPLLLLIRQVLGRDVVHQLALLEHQHALLHALHQAEVVAGHQHAGAALGQGREQRHDFRGQPRVEVAGRLVGHQQPRLADHRAGDADALLFTGRELGRQRALALGQAQALEHRAHALADLAALHAAQHQRQRDVVEHAAVGQQAVVLEHHADLAPVHRHPAAAHLQQVAVG